MTMEYFSPGNLSEALSLLGKWNGRATLVAGGTSLLPDMRANLLKPGVLPELLIDITRLKDLSYIKRDGKVIRIGALTPISEMASSRVILKYAPILADAALRLGNHLVRNRATMGGNLADASPAADTAVPLLALGAEIVMEKAGRKRRQIPIDRFFLGPNKTVRKSDEMIKEILFPKPGPHARMAYLKLGLRNAAAISVVSVAVVVEIEGDRCEKARIAFGAVAPKPIRAYGSEEILTGQEITEPLIEACCERARSEVNPITDIRATAEYRRSMASVLLKRAIQKAIRAGRE